jgi:GT2 family glycosyltransferase
MFSRAAIAKAGYPFKDFFIWGDDIEYTLRIAQYFPGYVVLDSIVNHQTKANIPGDEKTTDKFSLKMKYYYRNTVALMLLARASLLRRTKRVIFFLIPEIRRAKSLPQIFRIVCSASSGILLYRKLRKSDLHQ